MPNTPELIDRHPAWTVILGVAVVVAVLCLSFCGTPLQPALTKENTIVR